MFCPKCGAAIDDAAQFCPTCGAAVTATQSEILQQPIVGVELPMKWYKFLINFALFAGAVLNFLSAISLLTGSIYGEEKELVYLVFEDLKTVDTLVGIALLGAVVLAVYTRFRLAGYHENGPKMVLITYGYAALVNLIYYISLNSVLPAEVIAELDISSTVSSFVTSAVLIWANYVYFKKRKDLFINP